MCLKIVDLPLKSLTKTKSLRVLELEFLFDYLPLRAFIKIYEYIV